MSASNGYATEGRKKILEYLQKNPNRSVTAADIHTWLEQSGSKVNPTTIYRYLGKLEREGMLLKYVAKKGDAATYQFVGNAHRCSEHLHLKCVRCGCILHLDCGFMDEIREHISAEHGFELQCRESVLYGICEECKEKSEKL